MKSDVDRLKSKNIIDVARDNDKRLAIAWDIAMNAFQHGVISIAAFDQVMGKFMVRSMLTLLGKQKHGPEKHEFADLNEVRTAFITTMKDMCGDAGVDLGVWSDVVVEPASSSGPTQKEQPTDDRILSPADHDDPRLILTKNKFNVNDYVREKGSTAPDIYILQCITADGDVHLKLHDMHGVTDLIVNIHLTKFLASWGRYVGKVQCVVKPDPRQAVTIDQLKNDILRCRVYEALMAHETAAGVRSLVYVMNPHGVVASAKIQKGQLELAPLTTLANLNIEIKPRGSVCISIAGYSVFAVGPSKPALLPDVLKATVIPRWWVETTHVQASANMKVVATKSGDSIIIPTLQNARDIQPNERLLVFKEKEAKAPTEGTTVVEKAKASGEPPMPKKARIAK